MRIRNIKISIILLSFALFMSCSTEDNNTNNNNNLSTLEPTEVITPIEETTDSKDSTVNESKSSDHVDINSFEQSKLDVSEIFTERDLEQTANLDDGICVSLQSNEDILISEAGVYILSGSVEEVTITIETDSEDKVQLVLDGVSITNKDLAIINIVSVDKVFITTTDSQNVMTVSEDFQSINGVNVDAVIYSKSDLVINGLGSLEINSSYNGIVSKDDLKITGGHYTITSIKNALEANDSISMYDGSIVITTNQDGFHSENDDNDALGYVYIRDGDITIMASDDAISGNSIVQIDGGTINIISSSEGIESTYIQINDGEINIYATDDGINATAKTTNDIVIEVNGGLINVKMAEGDTDGFDSNGDIYINGGTISVEAVSAFDSDGESQLNGGNVTVNGEQITEITQVQMGGRKNN